MEQQDVKIERGLIKTGAGYIHYRATGQGKPIILLHINQQSSALYLELLAVLGHGSRAVAIDYPSHGMSDHISFQPSIADYAKCVIEVMDALRIGCASVLGEAIGAVVTIELAAAYRTVSGKQSSSIARSTRTAPPPAGPKAC